MTLKMVKILPRGGLEAGHPKLSHKFGQNIGRNIQTVTGEQW